MKITVFQFIDELEELSLTREDYSGNFRKFITEKIVKYRAEVRKIDSIEVEGKKEYAGTPIIDLVSNNISNLTTAIISCLKNYENGDLNNAYSELKLGLDKVLFGNAIIKTFYANESDLFRIRVAEQGSKISCKEIFHISMNEREKVSSQRFSIPGLPCLYLSTTLYLCWLELNQPHLTNCYASYFQVIPSDKKPITLLDLTNIHPLLKQQSQSKNPNFEPNVIRYLSLWPLIAACTVKVKHPKLVFKPEYIIPQLLLQYIRQHKNPTKIDGIKYSSTRFNYYSKSYYGENYNVAIPIAESTDDSYCNFLTNSFALTKPVSWEMFNILYPSYNLSSVLRDDRKFEFIEGEEKEYNDSTFGVMEAYLQDKKDLYKLSCSGTEELHHQTSRYGNPKRTIN